MRDSHMRHKSNEQRNPGLGFSYPVPRVVIVQHPQPHLYHISHSREHAEETAV